MNESTGGGELGAGAPAEGGEGEAVEQGQQVGGQAKTGMSPNEQSQAKAEAMRELQGQDLEAMVKVKINGKEQSMKVRDALKRVELGEGAQGKMQQAAQMRQQAQQLIDLAKSNPRQFFKLTGVDAYEFAESTLAEKYELMQMTPEQKRMRELEEKTKTYEEREKEAQQQREHAARTQVENQIRAGLEKDIVEAWKESGLPKHKYFAARISAEMLSSLAQKKAGVRDEALQAREAAAIVKGQVVNELKDILLQVARSDAGAAQQLLGDELMKIFRDHDVRRVTGKASQTNQQRPGTPSPASGKSNANKPLSEKEWNNYFKSLKT